MKVLLILLALFAAVSQGVNFYEPYPIDQDLWGYSTPFTFFSLPIQNHAVIYKVPASSRGPAFLAAFNLPELNVTGARNIHKLEGLLGAKVRILMSGGDWHHFFIKDWLNEFPQANAYVVSQRVLKQEPILSANFSSRVTVLDRDAPVIPAFGSSVSLLPFRGCRQPIGSGDPGDADRTEVVPYIQSLGTIFATDHIQIRGQQIVPNTIGFRVKDPSLAKFSALSLLGLKPRRVVFSHGPLGNNSYSAPDLLQQLQSAYAFFGV
eukprot:TRINITY_DN241_c0_g1_i1.p1 TRINITY_DN241_c0_g1~~TRINITY_DN241_c0_g1_i1.p1  ORF type:complete len:264 (+),score=87.53 TRINITY_DN241_c0_g1_i1:59-850(+)